MSDYPLLVGRTLEGDLPPAVHERLDLRYQHVTPGRTIHVSPAGAGSGDGSSSGAPVSVTRALAILAENARPVLPGDWTIQLTAGTHNWRNVEFPEGLVAEGTVTITGPDVAHPSVPTATITNGYNATAVGLVAREPSVHLIFKAIHLEGYNGTTSASGITIAGNARRTDFINVHATDCYWGVSMTKGSRYTVDGGIFTRCGYRGDTPNTAPSGRGSTRGGNGAGIRGLQLAVHSIGTQGAGSTNLGPYFYDSKIGVSVQEGCTGHVDWCRIENCETGILGNVNSRVNADGSSFKRNGTDVDFRGGSHVFLSPNTTFGAGADVSNRRVSLSTGAQITESDRIFTDQSVSYSRQRALFVQEYPASTITGTAVTTIRQVTLAAGFWNDIPTSTVGVRTIQYRITGTLTGTAGNKTISAAFGPFGNVTSTVFPNTYTGPFVVTGQIAFPARGQYAAQMEGQRHNSGPLLSRASGAVSMDVDRVLQLRGQLATGTDSITVDSVEMSWL